MLGWPGGLAAVLDLQPSRLQPPPAPPSACLRSPRQDGEQEGLTAPRRPRPSSSLPSSGSLTSPSWLMMYRGMSVFIPWPTLACPSAASRR